MLRTRRLVLDMDDSRALMRVPDGLEEQLRSALSFSWELVRVRGASSGRGDGSGGQGSEAAEAVADAEIYLGYGAPEPVLRAGPGLRWVHSGTAGVASSITPALRESGVVFTNSAGVHAVPVAETALAMVLHFARGLDVAVRAQAAAEWRTEPFDAAASVVREVSGAALGIIGYGCIGHEVARRACALGMSVTGVKRRKSPVDKDDWATIVSGREGVDRVLSESDFVVVAAPETRQTRGLIDARALERMRRGAVLVNVARGSLVDEEALLRALRDGRLRGAGLDVFATEPLPASHPYWRMANVLITPHVSGYSDRFWAREAELILDNLGRYLRGRPLRNVVDLEAGY